MKRTRGHKGSADAILTADLHLTEKIPVSRTDDYQEAQRRKLVFLGGLSNQNDGCPILCAGDIFHHWKASPWLCLWAYRHLPELITIPGNHDLPMHSFQQYEKSALALLGTVGGAGSRFCVLTGETLIYGGMHITGAPFGMLDMVSGYSRISGRNILMLHELVWPQKRPQWGDGHSAEELLDRYGDVFDLIVTGDNHEGFVYEKKNSILVNPGSMMRMTADQENYEPRCYLYYGVENEVVPVPFPIEQGVHNREHIDRKQQRDERIAAYIERMGGDWQVSLSFRQNLQEHFDANNVQRKVRELIWAHLETD